MMLLFRRFIILFFFFIAVDAHAGMLDLNLFYTSDSLTNGSSSTYGKTFYDFVAALNIDHKGAYQIGWSYGSYASTETVAGSTTTYTATQMGPKVIFSLNKDHNWLLGLTYNILSNASFQAGSSPSETWRGTAYAADIGYHQLITESLMMGLRLNYSASTYTEKLIGTAYSTVSYTRTFIYPSFAISFVF
jgi:hypothetical protein